MSSKVHVINKAKLTEHHIVSVDAAQLPQLERDHVRVPTVLHSFTSNNLSYARMGSILKWWDAYPVPTILSQPYNDTKQYGIVPVWGYAEVVESKNSGIENGTIIWGFWPSLSLPVDLQLVPGAMEGLWIETSGPRSSMMPLYNRYTIPDAALRLKDFRDQKLNDLAAETVLRPTFQCGYLLNTYTFGDLPMHPLGLADQWSKDDADLSAAIVINLSASGKTAKGFTDALVHDRKPGTGPLGLLAITTKADPDLIPSAEFPTKTISYPEIERPETIDWISQHLPKKIVICNFGGRGDSLNTLVSTLQAQMPTVKIQAIIIGSEPTTDLPKGIPPLAGSEWKTMMNTSGIKDAVIARMGEEQYAEHVSYAWKAFVGRGHLRKLNLQWGYAVDGEQGIEGGWNRLCGLAEGVPSDSGLVYKLV